MLETSFSVTSLTHWLYCLQYQAHLFLIVYIAKVKSVLYKIVNYAIVIRNGVNDSCRVQNSSASWTLGNFTNHRGNCEALFKQAKSFNLGLPLCMKFSFLWLCRIIAWLLKQFPISEAKTWGWQTTFQPFPQRGNWGSATFLLMWQTQWFSDRKVNPTLC